MVFIRKMRRYICEFDPDVIICTHCLAGILVDIIKQRYQTHAETIGILTDFAFHPYWEEMLHFDYIVTPSERLNMRTRKKGFRDEQILPFGIPIDPKFSSSIPKEDARERIGIDRDKRTVLLMSGSMGYGNITETVESLDRMEQDFQIIAVCGNNASVKEKLDGMKTKKRMIVYGYTNEIELLMDASDCIVTKPGGLTTSEALAKLLPMVIVNPIPGQEERNTQFLLNNGAAMAVNDLMTVDEVLYILFSSQGRIDGIREAMRELSKPDSTKEICDFAQKLITDRT